MSIEIKEYPAFSERDEDEYEFVYQENGSDPESGSVERLEIHPWMRHNTSDFNRDSVYSAMVYWDNAKDFWESYTDSEGRTGEYMTNLIMKREDFVEGLLAVFPELKRA